MRVVCRKIINATMGVDMGESNPWLKKGKEYVVLALNFCEGSGIDIYIQTEDYNEPRFIMMMASKS